MKLNIQVSLPSLNRRVRQLFLLLVFCFLPFISIGQNLVNNGGFEDITNCNFSYGDIDTAIGWGGVRSPEIFNNCNVLFDFSVPNNFVGAQIAYDNGYAFFASYAQPPSIDSREYVQTKLVDSLVSDLKYYLSFQISFADDLQYASDGIGAFVSMDTVYGVGLGQIIDSIPQVQVPNGVPIIDKTNWVKVDGCFIAKGGESFLTIGNFKHDSGLTIQSLGGTSIFGGYYLDDVQLHEIPALKSDSNHFICNGIIDSTFLDLSDTSEVTTYSWFPTNGLTNPTLPQTWAKPSVTTTYTLSQYTPCDTSTIDVTVFVGANACDSLTTGVSTLNTQHSTPLLYPNPNTGEFTFNYELTEPAQLVVYTITGQELSTHQLQAESKTIRIFDNELENGIYFYKVLIKDEIKYTGKFAIVK